jgi:Tfp pilus assembly protein PilF
MKHSAKIIALVLLVWCFSESAPRAVAAREQWTSLRSKNFFLVGNASEKDIRKVATQLEQFREVFRRLSNRTKLTSQAPMRVIVFKNDASFHPFMPVWQGRINEVAGYFQPGQDVNHISLTSEFRENNPFATIFHEYVHAITNDNFGRMPLWFNEGLAEFYSMFEVSDGDKKVLIGKPIGRHVLLLRENKFLPLSQLFSIAHNSSEYNERDKKGIFYAQSWALVHYLILGNQGKRQPQFASFIQLLSTGASIEDCFRKAFETDFATLEKELRAYIGRSSYPVTYYTFTEKLTFDSEMQASSVSEAEWQAYLGDLLLHQGRGDCEKYLKRALELDSSLPLANAAMGQMHFRAGRFDEAREYLQKAVASPAANNPESFLLHYYYAFVLTHRNGIGGTIMGIPPETLKTIRRELQQAIALNPEFAESYNLLVFANLVTGEQLAESVPLIRKAITLAPARQDLVFMLAQLLYRQEKHDEAEKILKTLTSAEADTQVRSQAQTLLEAIAVTRRYQAESAERMKQMQAEADKQGQYRVIEEKDSSGQSTDDVRPYLRRREGHSVEGLLMRIDCPDSGITLFIKVGNKTLRLHSTAMERVKFVSYSPDVSTEITCGTLTKPLTVVVQYNPAKEPKPGYDGEPLEVSFVKAEK